MSEIKVWGTTERVTINPAFEFHRLEINRGGYCSKHRHWTKFNGFYLESGRLRITEWNGSHETVTDMTPGQYATVKPGVYHQFEALEDCVAFELYWAEYSPEDIERVNVGGMNGS